MGRWMVAIVVGLGLLSTLLLALLIFTAFREKGGVKAAMEQIDYLGVAWWAIWLALAGVTAWVIHNLIRWAGKKVTRTHSM